MDLRATPPTLYVMDFGYFGPMFRHFYCDPDSGRIMRREAPLVHAWVERLWSARASTLGNLPTVTVPISGSAFDALLSRIGRRYLPYLQRNAEPTVASAR